MQFLKIAEKNGLRRVISIQNEYSLLCRIFDNDLAELCHHEDIHLMAFLYLQPAFLPENTKNVIPTGSRLDLTSKITPGLSGRIGPNTFNTVDKYLKVASQHDISPVHMALAFCASRPFMGSVIFGATTKAQLSHILGGLHLTLSAELLTEINKVNRSNPMPI